MPKKYFLPKGFTLVEIMVAVTILAILAIAGSSIYAGAIQKARIAKVQIDLEAISKTIQIARHEKNDVIGNVTGNFCTECAHCRISGTRDPDCVNDMRASYAKLTDKELPTDPWGGIYTFDENEFEPGSLRCCTQTPDWNSYEDSLGSAGPDNILWTSDDIRVDVPSYVCRGETQIGMPEDPLVNHCACTSGPNCVLSTPSP